MKEGTLVSQKQLEEWIEKYSSSKTSHHRQFGQRWVGEEFHVFRIGPSEYTVTAVYYNVVKDGRQYKIIYSDLK
jgi:hypothetical protein